MNITTVRITEVFYLLEERFTKRSLTYNYIIISLILTLIAIVLTLYIYRNSNVSEIFDKVLSTQSKACSPEIDKEKIPYPYYTATYQNVRPYQEDRFCTVGNFNNDADVSFFSVFDGHGGAKCSQFCANNLYSSICKSINTSPYTTSSPKARKSSIPRKKEVNSGAGFLREMDIINGFQLCDALYKGSAHSDGSTVVAAFVNQKAGQLITAHVGDSRAVMVTETSSYDLTADHKPSNPSEKERVELLGGEIIQYGVLRVQGILAVTRALGDFSLRPYVSNTPSVNYYELKGDECFLVIACDGLWDVLDHKEVRLLIESYVMQKKDMADIAWMLVETAVKKRSADNITVIVVDLRRPGSPFGVAKKDWDAAKKEPEGPEGPEGPENAGMEGETVEERIRKFDAFLKESIEVLEKTIATKE